MSVRDHEWAAALDPFRVAESACDPEHCQQAGRMPLVIVIIQMLDRPKLLQAALLDLRHPQVADPAVVPRSQEANPWWSRHRLSTPPSR